MPNKAAAWKHLRQTKRRTTRNDGVRAGIVYLRRQYAKALAVKDAAKSSDAFRALQKALDRAAGKGVIKANTASRLKSRASAKLKTLA
ncbi:MAG: 30S ribosomal protein S20 [bacterium]|nr:30S ribosomal protein S20 [bacterium]